MKTKTKFDFSEQGKVGSREAVETAIERSKDGRQGTWEKPARPGVYIPRWEKASQRKADEEKHP
jgi:hypothetical protein